MVVTDLQHMTEQVAMTPNMEKALAFLKKAQGQELADGRIEVDGDRVYALVQSYESIATDQPKFEAHKKYLDIQFVVSGKEAIGWAHTNHMHETMAYDAAKDVWLGTVAKEDMTPVLVSAGQAAVLYPTDAHAPKLAAGKPALVKKIVVKVAV